MKAITLLPALLALALGAVAPRQSVRFAPAEASELSKTFEIEGEIAIDDLSITMMGEEADPDQMGIDEDEMEQTGWMKVTVRDRYEKVADGRPLALLRTYESFDSSDGDGDSDDFDPDELVGKTVRFAWSEDDGDYSRSFEEGEGEDDMLAVLAEDLDLRAFLPRSDVEVGDTWEVEWEDCGVFLVPYIDIERAIERTGDDVDVPEEILDQLREAIGGFSMLCEYTGSREVDGVEMGIIRLSSLAEADLDLADTFLAMAEASGDEEVESLDVALFEILFEAEADGEILWDLGAGHFSSARMRIDFEAAIDAEAIIEPQEGFELEMAGSGEVSGELSWKATAR